MHNHHRYRVKLFILTFRFFKKVNINFLALDFDLTIVDIHTGGRWNGSIDELVSRIRPVFGHLIRAAHSAGLHIAIVTFSPQVAHITRVVEKAFPQVHEHIVVRIHQAFVFIFFFIT